MVGELKRRGQQLLLAKVRNASGRIDIFKFILNYNLQKEESEREYEESGSAWYMYKRDEESGSSGFQPEIVLDKKEAGSEVWYY